MRNAELEDSEVGQFRVLTSAFRVLYTSPFRTAQTAA